MKLVLLSALSVYVLAEDSIENIEEVFTENFADAEDLEVNPTCEHTFPSTRLNHGGETRRFNVGDVWISPYRGHRSNTCVCKGDGEVLCVKPRDKNACSRKASNMARKIQRLGNNKPGDNDYGAENIHVIFKFPRLDARQSRDTVHLTVQPVSSPNVPHRLQLKAMTLRCGGEEEGSSGVFLETGTKMYDFNCDHDSEKVIPTCLDITKEEYDEANAEMAEQTKDRIVGGEEAKSTMVPWQVFITMRTRNNMVSYCGAVLVSNNAFVTAAHCIDEGMLDDRRGREKAYAAVGLEDRDDTRQGQRLALEYCEKKSGRNGFETKHYIMFNDIGFCKLKGNIQMFRNPAKPVLPVCLPKRPQNPAHISCFASGFGTEGETHRHISPHLKLAYLPFADINWCAAQYDINGMQNINPVNHVCFGGIEGTDACKGDSGGPLTCYDERTNISLMRGVTSFGYGCGREDKPGVYVNVENRDIMLYIAGAIRRTKSTFICLDGNVLARGSHSSIQRHKRRMVDALETIFQKQGEEIMRRRKK